MTTTEASPPRCLIPRCTTNCSEPQQPSSSVSQVGNEPPARGQAGTDVCIAGAAVPLNPDYIEKESEMMAMVAQKEISQQ